MPYIGNTPALDYISYAVQNFTVTAGTTVYTLDYSVANENDIRLVINNVIQRPGASFAYSATGTTLTLTSATLVTDTMYAVFIGRAVQTVVPPAGSVTTTMLASGFTLPTASGGTGLTTIGTAGQALVVNSGATALQYSTVGATAGQVIQVVTDTDSTERATTSSSFVDVTGVSVSITPSSASNKIFVIATGGGGVDGSGLAYYTILRDSTNLGNGTSGMQVVRGNSGSVYAGATISVLDSPATTSATTYKVQFRSTSGTTNAFWGYENGKTSITVMEIKG
jgi:hypothetical protein